MAKLTLKQRIGIDIGRRVSVEDGIEWAAQNGVCLLYTSDAADDC